MSYSRRMARNNFPTRVVFMGTERSLNVNGRTNEIKVAFKLYF